MKKQCVPAHTAGLLAGLLALVPAASSTAATPAPLPHASAHTMPQKPKSGHTMSDMDDMDDMEGMDGMEDTAKPATPAKAVQLRQQAGQHPAALPTAKASTQTADKDNMASMNMATPAGRAYVSLPPLSPSARWPATPPPVPKVRYIHNMPPVMDHNTYVHILMEQLEGRYAANGSLFRYSGQAWFGTDHDKLWIKSEGTVDSHRTMSDGDHELLYDHALTTYFDLQAGTRLDLDSGPVRAWGAVGVQGLALYFFEVSATAYFNADGVAGKLEG
ncbi:copper resistance protein B, partial [Acetobacter peroxydans]